MKLPTAGQDFDPARLVGVRSWLKISARCSRARFDSLDTSAWLIDSDRVCRHSTLAIVRQFVHYTRFEIVNTLFLITYFNH